MATQANYISCSGTTIEEIIVNGQSVNNVYYFLSGSRTLYTLKDATRIRMQNASTVTRYVYLVIANEDTVPRDMIIYNGGSFTKTTINVGTLNRRKLAIAAGNIANVYLSFDHSIIACARADNDTISDTLVELGTTGSVRTEAYIGKYTKHIYTNAFYGCKFNGLGTGDKLEFSNDFNGSIGRYNSINYGATISDTTGNGAFKSSEISLGAQSGTRYDIDLKRANYVGPLAFANLTVFSGKDPCNLIVPSTATYVGGGAFSFTGSYFTGTANIYCYTSSVTTKLNSGRGWMSKSIISDVPSYTTNIHLLSSIGNLTNARNIFGTAFDTVTSSTKANVYFDL